MLFGIEDIQEGCIQFAQETRHTGSRKDYWPTLFTSRRYMTEAKKYGKNRLIGCKLEKDAPLFYSPVLRAAWDDQIIEKPERYDWFESPSVIHYFSKTDIDASFEMTKEHCLGLNKIEMAVLAAENLLK